MRETPQKFADKLEQPVTAVGYLLQITLPTTVLRWCNIGDFSFRTLLWSKVDFTITGLGSSAESSQQNAQVEIQNMDLASGALLQQVELSDCPVEVYQVVRGADGEAVHLADMAIDGGDISFDYSRLQLIPTRSRYAFMPRTRVSPAFGFGYAMPAGTEIAWGNQIITLEADRG